MAISHSRWQKQARVENTTFSLLNLHQLFQCLPSTYFVRARRCSTGWQHSALPEPRGWGMLPRCGRRALATARRHSTALAHNAALSAQLLSSSPLFLDVAGMVNKPQQLAYLRRHHCT